MNKMNKAEYLIIVGDRIRVQRETLNMSQDELAVRCGYKDRSSITNIEKGRKDAPASKMLIIADALGVPVERLVGGGPTGGVFNIVSDCPPNSDEGVLIEGYRTLNDSGRTKLRERMSELLRLPENTEKGVTFASSA